nr:hypothetical protein [Alcaligenes sp. HPC1271]
MAGIPETTDYLKTKKTTMITGFLTATLSLSFLFGGSDEKASSVKGDSAFTCAQINSAVVKSDVGSANQMLELSFRQLDKAYTNNSTIELFYRERLRGENRRYRKLLSDLVFDKCMENPKTSALDASTAGINKAYDFSKTQPLYAVCKAYNDKKISYENLIALASDPKATGYYAGPRVIDLKNHSSYGDMYLQEEISKHCAANPGVPALETMIEVTEAAYRNEIKKQEAEAKLRYEADMELHRQQEAESERKEFEKYSSSLYASTDDYVRCYEFHDQRNKSMYGQDPEMLQAYKAGLAGTLDDAVKLRTPYEQKELTAQLLNNREAFSERIDQYCVQHSTDNLQYALNYMVPPERLQTASNTHLNQAESTSTVVQGLVATSAYAAAVQHSKTVTSNPPTQKTPESVALSSPTQNQVEPAISNANQESGPSANSSQTDPFNRVAVINDPDGYTNVRNATNAKSKIIAQILKNERFSPMSSKDLGGRYVIPMDL